MGCRRRQAGLTSGRSNVTEQIAPGRKRADVSVTGRGPKRPGERYFFAAMGIVAIGIALIPFGPEFVEIASGSFPLAWVLHVHGALMTSWLLLFVAQAGFASTGKMALHRTLGAYGIALGYIVWVSMVVVEMRGMIVHPITDQSDYDQLLPGVYIYSLFPAYLTASAYLRKLPAWHKRLMLFTVYLALQAAVQRMHWLPFAAPAYWKPALYLDACLLIPLLSYDFRLIKRVHPATIAGTTLLLSAQTAICLAWGTPGWHTFAFHYTQTLLSIFPPA